MPATCDTGVSRMGHDNDAPPRMRISFHRLSASNLARHLVLVLAVKAVLLAGLWLVFIKPHRVAVDQQVMAAHIAGTPPSFTTENPHDRSNRR